MRRLFDERRLPRVDDRCLYLVNDDVDGQHGVNDDAIVAPGFVSEGACFDFFPARLRQMYEPAASARQSPLVFLARGRGQENEPDGATCGLGGISPSASSDVAVVHSIDDHQMAEGEILLRRCTNDLVCSDAGCPVVGESCTEHRVLDRINGQLHSSGPGS